MNFNEMIATLDSVILRMVENSHIFCARSGQMQLTRQEQTTQEYQLYIWCEKLAAVSAALKERTIHGNQ